MLSIYALYSIYLATTLRNDAHALPNKNPVSQSGCRFLRYDSRNIDRLPLKYDSLRAMTAAGVQTLPCTLALQYIHIRQYCATYLTPGGSNTSV